MESQIRHERRLTPGDHSVGELHILSRCHARSRHIELQKAKSAAQSHKAGQAVNRFLSCLPRQGWSPCWRGTDFECEATIRGDTLFVGLKSPGELLYNVTVDLFVQMSLQAGQEFVEAILRDGVLLDDDKRNPGSVRREPTLPWSRSRGESRGGYATDKAVNVRD